MHQLPLILSIVAGLVPGSMQIPADLAKRDSPVLPGFTSDPNIIAFGDTYYIYPTTEAQDPAGKAFYVYTSKNLVDWTKSEEPILSLNEQDGPGNCPWANGNAWAPTIIERGGKYYFYHSGFNPSEDRITIGVAVADSPEGPFTGQPEAMITNEEELTVGEVIDAMAFLDPETDKYWLYWGNGGLLHAELNDDMVSINEDTLGESTGLDGYLEAPFVVYREGLYHLTWSIDNTWSEDYRVGYATGASATGPWENHGVILQKRPDLGILGTAHHSILNVPGTDDWYIAYHRFAIVNDTPDFHREVTIDRMTFEPDTGLIQPVTPTLESVPPQEIKA